MEISVIAEKSGTFDCLVVLSRATGDSGKEKPALWSAPKEVAAFLRSDLEGEILAGGCDEALFYRNARIQVGAQKFQHLLVLGTGKSVASDALRNAFGVAHKKLNEQKVKSAALFLSTIARHSKKLDSGLQALAEGLGLAAYSFEDFLTGAKKKKIQFCEFSLINDGRANTKSAQDAIKNAALVVEAINFGRWLGDNPGNVMTPPRLAQEAQKAAKGTRLRVTAWDKARIKKEKMGGLLGVNLGGGHDPRFIVLEYFGDPKNKRHMALVGKGLTFDTGGVSIKPADKMDEMKFDMCGGATVIATLLAVARLKLKANVVGYVPSTENVVGPFANKPGDILTARNGKTVEVLNTDAEGRLILMDGLAYASEKKPSVIFDVATLTGAILVALGNSHTGVFTNHDKLFSKIQSAAEATGELIWQMPLHEEYSKDMKGTYADLQNIGPGRLGGSCTAAAFLQNFVGEGIPWAHFDIAGTGSGVNGRLKYINTKGASGAIIRTFVEFIRQGGWQ